MAVATVMIVSCAMLAPPAMIARSVAILNTDMIVGRALAVMLVMTDLSCARNVFNSQDNRIGSNGCDYLCPRLRKVIVIMVS